jgi:hypothetical protein
VAHDILNQLRKKFPNAPKDHKDGSKDVIKNEFEYLSHIKRIFEEEDVKFAISLTNLQTPQQFLQFYSLDFLLLLFFESPVFEKAP